MASFALIIWLGAGICALGASVSSLMLIWSHLNNYVNPELQRHVVRILWMVPVYASHSWLSLTFPSSAIYFDTIRDWYVFWLFIVFCLFYLFIYLPFTVLQLNVQERMN